MSKRNLLVLSIVFLVISVFTYFKLGDYIESLDEEKVHFFSGLFFALGIVNLIRIFIAPKK